MKNLKFSRLFAAMMFVACLAFTGCTPVTEEKIIVNEKVIVLTKLASDDMLVGDWVDDKDAHYVISKNDFDNYGSWGDSYAGNNLVVQEFSETEGTIFIKYTRAANPDWTYTTTAPDVGKWYAISYKNLTEDSIDLSGAWGDKSSCEKLEDAVVEFTIDNKYFGSYTTCTKNKN